MNHFMNGFDDSIKELHLFMKQVCSNYKKNVKSLPLEKPNKVAEKRVRQQFWGQDKTDNNKNSSRRRRGKSRIKDKRGGRETSYNSHEQLFNFFSKYNNRCVLSSISINSQWALTCDVITPEKPKK